MRNNEQRLTYFVQNLKNFIDLVKLPTEVFKDLKGIISHFAFILTIFKKYEDTLNICGIEGSASEKLKATGWLLYILARVTILKGRNEIVESACMLIAVLTTVITNKPQSVKFSKLKIPQDKWTSQDIKKSLCDIFKLKTPEVVDGIMEPFIKFLQQCFPGENTSVAGLCIENFAKIFSEEYLETSLRKLNGLYQQLIPSLDGIDERSFIASETRITTPVKLTPFARQGVANIIITPRKPKECPEGDLSKRELGTGRVSSYFFNIAQ